MRRVLSRDMTRSKPPHEDDLLEHRVQGIKVGLSKFSLLSRTSIFPFSHVSSPRPRESTSTSVIALFHRLTQSSLSLSLTAGILHETGMYALQNSITHAWTCWTTLTFIAD